MDEHFSNISSQQLNTFNELVNVWWGTDNTLTKMNKTRIPALVKYLTDKEYISSEASKTNEPLLGLNILDIGCGAGLMSEPLAILGANITGVDAASNLIECAKLHAKQNNKIKGTLTYICDTIENFAANNSKKFDIIVASEVVEHVNSAELFISSCLETLKPKGGIYITTINRTTKSWLVAIILYEYITKTIPKGIHEWNKFITPEEIQQILEKYNCKTIGKGGMHYSYLRDSFTFCEDISVIYYLFAIKN